MKMTITERGAKILQQKIDSKAKEISEILEELRIARESSSSKDDNPEVSVLTDRCNIAMGERSNFMEILSTAVIVDTSALTTDKVKFGVMVTVLDLDSNAEHEYQIVSPIESDIVNGLLSYESPLGSALIGCEVGDVFDFMVRGKYREFEVLRIGTKAD